MTVSTQISESVKRVLRDRKVKKIQKVSLEHPNDLANGDYSSNVAMKLSKDLKKNPLKIAEEIVGDLKKDKKLMKVVEKIEVAKPGFINFYLNQDFLLDEVKQILKQKDKYGQLKVGKGQTAMIEYSQMNVAKPMHVGHLRTAILGDSLKRLYQFLGFATISDTHYGDWGTQFGMVLYAYKNWGDEKKVKEDPVGELVRLYIDMSNKVENDPDLREKAKAEFKKLEDGDKENKKLWQWFVDASVKVFDEVYGILGILPFDHHLGESFYEDKMNLDLNELLDSGVATKEDDLIYVDLEPYNLGRCIMQKSDGATTYHLRDMATYRHRMEKLKVDRNLYVVDSRQAHHFKQLFKVLELIKAPGLKDSQHVSYGSVVLPEGSLSTRKGRIVMVDDVLKQGLEKAGQVIKEKNPGLENQQDVALEVTRAAIKFANLIANRNSDIVFEWDKVLTFEGDTGPYLQYTYARIQSVKRKVSFKPSVKGLDLNGSETMLLKHLYKFPEEVALSYRQNDPHFIAEYLLVLAHRFNSFYENSPIMQAEDKKEQQQRLAIAEAVAQVMKTGLSLLGISVVEEM